MTSGLIEKVGAIHSALTEADLPHAFGGALALAWCVGDPRATIDVDINVFIAEEDAALLRSALPSGVALSDSDIARLEDDGQVRVWWGDTPVDIFLNSTPLHESAAARTRWERLGRIRMPFLSCLDTAIFKAFFNRTRDWSDLERCERQADWISKRFAKFWSRLWAKATNVFERWTVSQRPDVRFGRDRPVLGMGRPEPLKHDFAGCWSRRITQEHRLVYKVEGGRCLILQCRYHY